jgi:DNA-binding MarR family transcriptional regulator
MSSAAPSEHAEQDRIMLGLLESVERDGSRSQRHIASELGIALGLVNAYLKRCIKKGLVKVSEAPARRYAYYLTPQGFAEKSRLTVDYLSYSFSFFRQAKADCAQAFDLMAARGYRRVVLAGISDLAEIAAICALERRVEIAAVVDCRSAASQFVGIRAVSDFGAAGDFDAILVTDVKRAAETASAAAGFVGTDRVFAPTLLGTLQPKTAERP